MHCALHDTVAHAALLRSNKRDASLIISKRLTRIGKLAGSLDEKPSDDEVEGNGAADAAEVAGGPVMRHGHAHVMSVAQLVADVLPNGAQYIGTPEICSLRALMLVHFHSLYLRSVRHDR